MQTKKENQKTNTHIEKDDAKVVAWYAREQELVG